MGSTRKNSKQIVMKTNENHDWLPDGWVVESKIRKSGVRVGTEYKYYIDPSSGSKFYSKPEVLRYLKTMKHNANISDQQKQGTAMESTSKSDTSQSPMSEPVPHHSNSAEESDHEYGHKTNGSVSANDKNVVVERERVDDLPDGWIKETRIRKTTHGIRKDPYYKDPVSGRIFRSKKEVFRFIGDKFKLLSAAEPQKLKHSSTRRELFVASKEESDLADVDVSAANMPKKGQDIELTAKPKVDCLIKTEVASGMQWPKSATTEPSDTEVNFDRAASALLKDEEFAKELDKRVSSEAGAVTPGAFEQAEIDIVNGKVQETYKDTRSKPGASNKKTIGGRSRYSSRLSGVELELGAETVADEHALQVVNGKSSQNRTILSNNLTPEESQMIAAQGIRRRSDAPVSVSSGLDGGITTGNHNDILVSEVKMQKLETKRIIEEKPEGKHCVSPGLDFTIKQVSGELPVEDSPHTALAFEEDLQQEDKLSFKWSEKVDYGKSQIYNKKGNNLPRRASKRLAGVEPELIGNSISCEKALEYTSKRSKKEVAVLPSATMVSQQLKGPEAENLYDEKGESNLSFSFHYSWSDPCLEFAIKTLTGALPVEDTVDGNPNLNVGKNNLRHGMDESSIKKVKTKKSKKELNLPSRSSKRLAGHKPELGSISSKRALEYNPRKSSKESQETSQPLEVATKIDLTRVNDTIENTSGIQLTNSSDMRCKAQAAPEERQKNVQVDEIECEKSGPQKSFPFCESWSDPCIDFAIKTLTGALSEDTAHVLPISNPEANFVSYGESSQNMGKRSIDNQICQPAKLPGSEPQWIGCSTSSNDNKKQAIEQSFGEDAKIERIAINGAFRHLETRRETELGKCGSTAATTSMHEAFSEKIQNDFACRTVPEVPHSGSFLESWSDPCLDFAIKTLTGAIPVEENLEIPGYLQQVHTSSAQAHAGSVLPDLGLPSFFLNDISSHFDVPDKSGGVQQSSLSLPLVAPGAASLANCAGTDASLRYSQSGNNMHEGKLLP